MRRREFISLVGGAATWSLAVRAQQPTRVIPRIGILWHAANEDEEAPYLGPFRQGLKDLGYIESENIVTQPAGCSTRDNNHSRRLHSRSRSCGE
jgi:putative tryptophan/tyrosine transport system substrate-binding protein